MNRRLRDEAQAFDEAWNSRARGSAGHWDHEVADLVACAEQLCESAVAEPSAEFRSALRTQLMTEASTVLSPVAARPQHAPRPPLRTPSLRFRRRLAGLTAALVSSAGFVGLVGASAEALPGEMLYPVKRGVENVELAFHKDDVARGEYRLEQASERLAEARRLTDSGSPQASDHIAGVLSDFAAQAKDGSGALFRAYGHSGSEESITVVNDFSASAAADLAQLSGKVPSEADLAFQTAASTVSQLVTKASTLCTSCGTADVSGLVDAVSSLTGAPAPVTDPIENPDVTPEDIDTTIQVPVDKSVLPVIPEIEIPDLTITPSPTSSPTKSPTKVKELTDPVVGGLVGTKDEPGLVDGLLRGLLGGGK